MNEFTKEELQYLLELVDSILIVNRKINDDELQEKLQSMIDNYDKERTYQVKLNLGLSHKEAECLVDEFIMPFLYPEKKR